jgi:hypothetical protein
VKAISCLFLVIFLPVFLHAQIDLLPLHVSQGTNPLPNLSELIKQVSIDSLLSFIQDLSGEHDVFINGQREVITSRSWRTSTNTLAADYLAQKLSSYGLAVEKQSFMRDGVNVIGFQEGAAVKPRHFIICAHYDDKPAVGDAPGADDNASGVAAVIEIARICSQYQFPYAITYALWDQEEEGGGGSRAYASEAKLNGKNISGVLNMDMIAFDSNNDGLVTLHSDSNASSILMSNQMLDLNTSLSIGLQPFLVLPGIDAGDQTSFWFHKYPAVLLMELFVAPDSSRDFNPYYHTQQDRIRINDQWIFNTHYFAQNTKLALAFLSASAMDLAPATPELFTPPNKDKFSGYITLTWSEITGCKYNLQISTDNKFSSLLLDTILIESSAHIFLQHREAQYWRVKAKNSFLSGAWSDVSRFDSSKLPAFFMEQNFPNPALKETMFVFSLSEPLPVHLEIFNIRGQSVAVLFDGVKEAGSHRLVWDNIMIPSGIYICRLQMGSYFFTKKMTIVR